MSHVARTLIAFALLGTSIAHAQSVPCVVEEAPPSVQLGQSGLYIITTDTNFDVGKRSYEVDPNDNVQQVDGTSNLDIRLAVDYSIAARWTVGAQLGFFSRKVSRESAFDENTAGTTAGARIGHLLPLGDRRRAWVWPRLGLDFRSTTYEDLEGGSMETRMLEASASAPVIWNAAGKFFVGGGPSIVRGLSDGGAWGWELYAVLGVFLGEPPHREADDGVHMVVPARD